MNEVSWRKLEYESIVRKLDARTGLVFRPHQRESTEKGIRHAMARSGIDDRREYVGLVEHDGTGCEHLVRELTVGETYFRRERSRFGFTREHILPEILIRRGPSHKIRIWSAACASGEEPYSLAILCWERVRRPCRTKCCRSGEAKLPATLRKLSTFKGPRSTRREGISDA